MSSYTYTLQIRLRSGIFLLSPHIQLQYNSIQATFFPAISTDVLFFALDSVGVVINPAVIIRTIDQNYALVEDVFTECRVTSIRVS